MDRNREARRVTMAASTNGLSSRRRHRSSSLRDSPEEDGPLELHEPARLRDRGVKKDRDRDRERMSRSKRRRNREDGGDDSSEESVNDEEDDDDDGGSGAVVVRMMPPNPAAAAMSNHHQQQQHLSRKSFPPSTGVNNNNKVFRPVQGCKPADEVISFSVPRKARSASTKRSHECWISGTGAGSEQIHRQASPSPAPLSPSSSNVSARKKMKPNGPKQKPPKSSSKASSSHPEELEIEIAEVLFGLMTQSQAPSKKETDSAKFDSNRQSIDAKSRVSSPISNSHSATAPLSSSLLPQNSGSSTAPVSAVAPKRKKPRQVSDNLSGSFSARNSTIFSATVKLETDLPPKTEKSLSHSENVVTDPENGIFRPPLDFAGSKADFPSSESLQHPDGGVETPAKEPPAAPSSPNSATPAVKPEDNNDDAVVTKLNSTSCEMEIQKDEKFEIDLMAPPPQLRSSPERESDVDFAAVAEHKPVVVPKADAEMKMPGDKEEKASRNGRDEKIVEEQPELKKVKTSLESAETEKPGSVNKERNIDLQLDLGESERENTESPLLSGNKSHPHGQKQQQPQLNLLKDEHPHIEKPAQSSSMPLPVSLANWRGGLPPMGYVAPLQGVVPMDGSQVPTTPVQPLFSQPRPKRCATHCYIARNIHYLQQFMKMNPFWSAAAAGSTSVFGAKPCNLNVIASAELHGRTVNSVVQDNKGQGLAIFPGHVGKDKASSQPAATVADAQKKQQQIFLQQALPAGAPPSNILHGPAFIFPFSQQQAAAAAAAAASVRPGTAKSPNTHPSLTSPSVSTSASASANGSAAAAPTGAAVSFNYPNMPANETQYLAILQNNAYPFPIPTPTYRGTHPQPMPFFNGSFYTSQMVHPVQLQQSSSQPPQQIHQGPQNTSISSGSSSSQKQPHLQGQQQRPQGPGSNGGSATGNAFPAPKTRPTQSSLPHQARNLEPDVGVEDSPSTADSRVSRGTAYGQNFAMPIHHQNFALISSAPALAVSSNGNNQNENKKQHQQQQLQQPQQLGSKPETDSLPQTFAMSFAAVSGSGSTPGVDLSPVSQNHAVLHNFPEAARHNYQIVQAAAAAQAAQQRKNIRVSEEGKNGGGVDSSNVDEEKKGLSGKASVTSGQSITFSRPDLTDPSVSPLPGTNIIDDSTRNLNLVSAQRGSRTSISNVMGAANSTYSQLQTQMQLQQQQMAHFQKQHQQLQQQMAAARNKTPATSNGIVHSDHLASSSPSAASKFPNVISGFSQNLVQSGIGGSPSQSPQWKSSTRTNPQVQPSATSSLKNFSQQQARPQQSHTQISFGSGHKSQTAPQGQQAATIHQSSSPPMGVSSPTTSSLSKGASGSPRTASSNSQGNKAAAQAQPSSLSSQQSKNSASVPNLKSPSILGNPHNITSSNSVTKSQMQQQQQQLKQMAASQPQLFFSPAFVQTQSPHSTVGTTSAATSTTGGYYLQRRYTEKQQQQGMPSATSTGMLSLCTPVSLVSTSTTDAKAVAASVSNVKGGGPSNVPSQSILHHPQFTAQSSGNFSYVHTVPAAVQVNKPTEQKQPAGNRNASSRK